MPEITEKKFMLVNRFTLLTPLIAININCTSVFIGVQISQDLDEPNPGTSLVETRTCYPVPGYPEH